MGDLSILASCFASAPVVSELNKKGHEHWRDSKDRHDAQKLATGAALRSMPIDNRVAAHDELHKAGVVLVRMTILSIHPLDDDNQMSAVKYFRDEIARWLEVDDKDPRVKWVSKWERYRGRGSRGVRIEFVRFLDHLLAEKAEIERQIAALRSST